jgi:hypothetical protein
MRVFSRERWRLAIADLRVVGQVATLLSIEEAGSIVVMEVDGSSQADPVVDMVVEAGLVVTYARPFTRSERSGKPLASSSLVPVEHRELHTFLIRRRHKYHAHTDGDAPPHHRRQVGVEGPWTLYAEPHQLAGGQLRELIHLTTKLLVIFDRELEDACRATT